MSWTYSGNPAASPTDSVRFLLGDTDSKDKQLLDAEIAWLLSENSSSVYYAAAQGAQQLAAKYGRLVDQSIGDLSISYSQRQKAYTDLAVKLRMQATTKGGLGLATPYAGGIRRSDKEIDETDTDRVKPAFTVGMHNNQGE